MKVTSVKLYSLLIGSVLILILSYTVVGIHIFYEMSRMVKLVRQIDRIKNTDTHLSYIADQLSLGVPHSSQEQEAWVNTLSHYNDSLQQLFVLTEEFSDIRSVQNSIQEFQAIWNSVYIQMRSIEEEFRYLNMVPANEVLSIYVERETESLPREKLYRLAQFNYKLKSYNTFIKDLLRTHMDFLSVELHREIAVRRKHLFIEALILIPLITLIIAILFFLLIKNAKKVASINERLSDMQRIQEIGKATGQISHDLKNMLAGIAGFTELSQEVPSLPTEVREYLEGIETITQRADSLCKSIENISKQGSTTFEELSLHQLFTEVKKIFPVILPKGVNFTVKLPERSIVIRGNELHLFQVFMNLAVNASHAMEKSGTISIETLQKSGKVTILVADTGRRNTT